MSTLSAHRTFKLFLYNDIKASKYDLTKGVELAMYLVNILSNLRHPVQLIVIIVLVVLDFIKHYPSITTYRAL